MEKRTKIIVIVCVSLFVLTRVIVLVPIVLAGVAFGGVTIFNFSKPDMSDDELIPSGYVETDGEQSYGAGDWTVFSYFVYDEMPVLDECFDEVTAYNQEPIRKLFDGYAYEFDESEPLINSKNLTGRISEGDYYYIESIRDTKKGGCIYYYDIQENALFVLDYAW
ncbi:MAG: hypothetical protein E7570_09600 [Ruminococcaceae bacterium]|nr:hypothetical protein [Oscillospiraceae bacterium]